MNLSYTGHGKVCLIAGGGKTYSDIAARFCNSERGVEEIIGSEESLSILHNIINSNHKAALEFDDFIFGIEGFSRVTEIQLVRKRHASYMIKSGRVEKHGKRSFDVVIPESIKDFESTMKLNPKNISLHLSTKRITDGEEVTRGHNFSLEQYLEQHMEANTTIDGIYYNYTALDILQMIENWYETGLHYNKREEDLRYLKPQATEFKACIKMNAAALRDWFQIRLCNRAQFEIRDLARKMYRLCTIAAPALFEGSGPSCKVLGYCPENDRQCSCMKDKVPTKEEALKYLKGWKKEN